MGRIARMVTALFLLGCGGHAPELVQDIYLSDRAPASGKLITNLGFFYSEPYQDPATLRRFSEALAVVRFNVQNAVPEDVEKVHGMLVGFFAAKFRDQYRVKVEDAGPAWIERTIRRYVLKDDFTANPRKYADMEWHGDDGLIKVRLGCSVACDVELLEQLLGQNLIAPLSPQATNNYELLKARLFGQAVDLKRLAGKWRGEMEGADGTRGLTVTVAEDGSFSLTVPTTDAHWQGKIAVRESRIYWWNYTTGASGLMTYSEDGKSRYIRGARHDGTHPFRWWSDVEASSR